jgi:hypothetical protein
MISMERIELSRVPWDVVDRFADRTIMQTRAWLNFIAATKNAEIVVAAVKNDDDTVGYFTGLIVKKFGVRILGSPFKGWASAYMGFNLPVGWPRREVLKVLPAFAFKKLQCHYLELTDRYLCEEDYKDLGYAYKISQGYEIDLSKSEEELFANMYQKSCRWCINKAKKCGVVIEEASDAAFADDYYVQLTDVFAKQSLVPPHRVDRVQQLIKYIFPTGNLLLLRAKSPEGVCIATGIFPAYNGTAYFWGAASWRQYQNLCPNEPLFWYALKYWKAHGCKKFNMGGGGNYKRKYGCHEIFTVCLMKSRYGFLIHMRNLAHSMHRARQKISIFSQKFPQADNGK